MIKNSQILEEFNKAELKNEKKDYFHSLKIFEEMWQEGILLGVLPLKNPLEGIEVDIKIARILNHSLFKNPDFDLEYTRQWLKEFDRAVPDGTFSKTFEDIQKKTR